MQVNGKTVKKLHDSGQNTDRQTEKQQVFIIGSKGIPASYGGFETFVEKLTELRKNENICYHVSCLASDNDERYEYNGAACFNVKVPNIGPAKAIVYDVRALRACVRYCKDRPWIKQPIFYILACRIGPFIGQFKREIHQLGGQLYINPDGHEWKRKKWSAPVRAYWKLSEKLMVKNADLLICDSKNIERYIHKFYGKFEPQTTYISYGSDLNEVDPSTARDAEIRLAQWYEEKGLKANEYYLIVGRFVPENNYETVIREFMASDTKKTLAIITTRNEAFLKKLNQTLDFQKDSRIQFVGTVYDAAVIHRIRQNAYAYIHGHEVGGTNPSLLEAMGNTKINLLLDVCFNREVGEDSALYWTKETGNLSALIHQAEALSEEKIEQLGEQAKNRMRTQYSWENIVKDYENKFYSEESVAL